MARRRVIKVYLTEAEHEVITGEAAHARESASEFLGIAGSARAHGQRAKRGEEDDLARQRAATQRRASE